ncbi:MAG: protein kinase [Planctomycetota bacterium]
MASEDETAANAGPDETSSSSSSPTSSSPSDHPNDIPGEKAPEIEGFRVIRKLGAGGFGAVYLAEQQEPIKRQVAIKLLRDDDPSGQVLARFEAERQAMALMDHPSVARVFDAGVTRAGLPYFVMEYIRGARITEHCEARRLPIEDRLALMCDVCDAVQHAHAKGVVHRDLKPGNIMVAIIDDAPVVKVIDFGIAKAIETKLAPAVDMTREGQVMGTPMYMAPEQAGGDVSLIDTRTDVYALGAVLYEVLTGSPPFDSERMRLAAFLEWMRIVQEETPPKPSTRLVEQARTASGSTRGSTRTTRLARTLRRDLDWVVMRCLEKPRERRYQSAAELASELRRYLRGDPVEAGPPTARYRLWKLASKNKATTIGVLTTAAALLAGAAVSATFALRENTQRERAEDALRVAVEEREVAQAVSDFLVDDLIRSVSPGVDGPDVRVLTVVERAIGVLDERLDESPEIRARLRSILGRVLLDLGETSRAEDQFREALGAPGDQSPAERASLEIALAEAMWRQSKTDEALAMIADARARLGEAGLQESAIGLSTLNARANALKHAGRLEEAEPIYDELIAGRERLLGPDAFETLQARYNRALLPLQRGIAARAAGHEDAGLEHERHGFELMAAVASDTERALGGTHPQTFAARSEEILLLRRIGRLDEAMDGYAALLPSMRRTLTDTHWRVIDTIANYGRVTEMVADRSEDVATQRMLLERTGRLYEEAVAGYRVSRGPIHSYTVTVSGWLARVYEKLGRADDAATVLEQLYEALGAEPSRAGDARTIARRLVALYEGVGADDLAASWRDRARLAD